MAAYISVPRDLTRVKSKVLFGLTKRQIVCFGTGALIGVPVYFFVRAAGNLSLAALAMIVVMLPFFFFGLYERNGQPPEVVARQFYQARFVRPKVRPYRINNYYAALAGAGTERNFPLLFPAPAAASDRRTYRPDAQHSGAAYPACFAAVTAAYGGKTL